MIIENGLDKLKKMVDDSKKRNLTSFIKSPDSLYDYIKAGMTFDDYVRDFENGSILKGKVVSDGISDFLVALLEFGDWGLIDLETSNNIQYYSDEETILDDCYVRFHNLADYYADKLVADSIENIKDRYNQAIYNLSDENKELKEQLDYADCQLEKQSNVIYKLEDYVHELNENIISIIKEG